MNDRHALCVPQGLLRIPKRREERKEDANENQEEAKDPGGMELLKVVCAKNSPSSTAECEHSLYFP